MTIDMGTTIAETGWTRIDGNTMRYVGRPPAFGNVTFDRDYLELGIRQRNGEQLLVLVSASIHDDVDPDAEGFDIDEDVLFSQRVELPAPAALVLHAMLCSVAAKWKP